MKTRRDVLFGATALSFLVSAPQVKAMPHDGGISIVDHLQHLRLEHKTSYVSRIGMDPDGEYFIELGSDSSGSLLTSIVLRGETFEKITFKFWGRFTGRHIFPAGKGISVQTSKFDPDLHGLLVFSGGALVAFL